LNSNINAGRQQQQYHRPSLTVDENLNKSGTENSYDKKESMKALTEILPFENYRTIDNKIRNNNNSAGAKRLSNNNDEDGHDGDIDEEEEDEDNHEQSNKKLNEQNLSQPSRQLNLIGDSFSRNIPSSTFIDTSVRSSPNTSTILMMMKGNGEPGDYLGEKQKSSVSSLSIDEHRRLKSRRYNFVPAPFNGTRLIAKSTEQLNHSFANDSLVNYPTPSFQFSIKTNSPTSILKQKYTPSAIIQSSSKIMHA